MRKHKLFLPILLVFTILIIGTSLALGSLNNGEVNNYEAAPPENEPVAAADGQNTNEQDTEVEVDQPDLTQTDDVQEDSEESLEATEETEEKAAQTEDKKPAEDPAPQPEKDKQMATVTVNDLNLRPAPSTDNQPLDVLSQGQTVEVLAEQNNWLRVKLSDGRIGWVHGAYVNRTSPSKNAGSGSLSGRIIVIDPGHGGTDPGAVGVTGLPEKEVVLDVSLRVAAKLRSEGAKVIMTRDTDIFIPLGQRVSIAEAAGAEVFVSVHANAHPSPSIGGTETYYFGNKAASGASYNLAGYMQNQLAGALGLRDIGVKDASFLVIRETSMPSVLLELGFLSNAHEESLMRTDEFRRNAADAIVRGLINYFN